MTKLNFIFSLQSLNLILELIIYPKATKPNISKKIDILAKGGILKYIVFINIPRQKLPKLHLIVWFSCFALLTEKNI